MARRLRQAAAGAPVPAHDSLVRMIRRWEAGDTGMTERYQFLYQRALGLREPPAAAGEAALAGDVLSADPGGDDKQVQRREFVSVSAALAGALAVPPQLADLAAGRRIGADMPAMLRQRLARLRRLDDYLGGSETYGLYLSELEATRTLAREAACTGETRAELAAVISEQGQQAGWAAFDAGWQATARMLYQDSLADARSAGSRPLEGNSLALLAYQNLTTGEPAAGLAQASCDAAGPSAPPRVRALLHERRAWAIAHSAPGEASAVRQALGTAAAALGEPGAENEPDWAAWVNETEIEIMTGRCLTRIGQPLSAIPVLHAALRRFDDTHARDKALYTSWLAEAYLDAGEIDSAAVTAGQVLSLSAGVASARPAQRVREIIQRLSSHSAAPAVADLLDRAADATPTTWPG